MAGMVAFDGTIAPSCALQDSANSLFDKEVSCATSASAREETEVDASEVGTLDGFLLCDRAAAELPEHVFHAKVSGLKIERVVEEDLTYFTSLTSVDLSDNRIRDIAPMRHFAALRELNVACNGMRSLGLHENILRDCFQSLRFLDVSYNAVSEEDVDVLALLPRLEKLDISHNNLRRLSGRASCASDEQSPDGETIRADGALSARFPSLRVLNAESNKLQGACVQSLSLAPKLEDLRLSYNLISGLSTTVDSSSSDGPVPSTSACEALPTRFFPSLRRIDLSHNRIRNDASLRVLSAIPKLCIFLEGNPCADTCMLRRPRARVRRTDKHRKPPTALDAKGGTTPEGIRKARFAFRAPSGSQRATVSGHGDVLMAMGTDTTGDETGGESTLRVVSSSLISSYENSFDRGNAESVSRSKSRKVRTRTFAPMPDDGWRQGLMPKDADGIGGVLGVVSHEKLEAAFRRLESEVQHRRTSELLSGIERFQAERGDNDFIIEEGEEGEEDSDGDSEEEFSSEEDEEDGSGSQQEILLDGGMLEGRCGADEHQDASTSCDDLEKLKKMIDDTESRRWNEIQSSTQSAVNALRVFLSRSTMLEEPIIQPRYRSMTKSRSKQIQSKQSASDGRTRASATAAPRAGDQSAEVVEMDRMLNAMEERLNIVDNTMSVLSSDYHGHER